MRASPDLAITGSTGAIGGRVAARLAARGVPRRLVVRDPAQAPLLEGAVPVAAAAYGHADDMRRALEGARTLFFVSGRETQDRLEQHLTAVEAARATGVERIVYLSFMAAAPDATFTLARQHYATEKAVRATGARHTFLRSSLYADFVPYFTGPDGPIRGPAGNGRLAWVTWGRHRQYSRVAERPISYQEETSMRRGPRRAPAWEIEGWVTSYAAVATGEMDAVSDAVERVAGHPPWALEPFLRANPQLWAHLGELPCD